MYKSPERSWNLSVIYFLLSFLLNVVVLCAIKKTNTETLSLSSASVQIWCWLKSRNLLKTWMVNRFLLVQDSHQVTQKQRKRGRAKTKEQGNIMGFTKIYRGPVSSFCQLGWFTSCNYFWTVINYSPWSIFWKLPGWFNAIHYASGYFWWWLRSFSWCGIKHIAAILEGLCRGVWTLESVIYHILRKSLFVL